MPIIKSAKKKLRQDKKRRTVNSRYEKAVKSAMTKLKKAKDKKKRAELIRKAYSVIDRAAKKKVIHKNKASRLKSMVSRMTAK